MQLKLKPGAAQHGAIAASGGGAQATGSCATCKRHRRSWSSACSEGCRSCRSPACRGCRTRTGKGQLIALGLSPADVRGPVEMPGGNRSGEFHASPGGKADAPGTPNVKGDASSTTNGAGGSQGKGNGSGSGNSNGLPTGISVGNPPPGAATSAVAGTPTGKPIPSWRSRSASSPPRWRPSIPRVNPTAGCSA